MRVWTIPIEYLDDKRLLAQHHEVHVLVNSVLKNQERTWPTVRRFKNQMGYIVQLHEQVVAELRTRHLQKYDRPALPHLSQFPVSKLSQEHFEEEFNPSIDQMKKDTIDLRQKWKEENYRFGEGRFNLRNLEEVLGIVLKDPPK